MEFPVIPLWLIWFIAGMILIIVEIFTPGFFLLMFGLACFVSGVVAVFTSNLIILFSVYLVSMVVMTIFLRPVFLKYLVNKNARKSNIGALIGKTAIVDVEIDNVRNEGHIKVGADYFKALSKDGNVIPKGKIVVIESMEGITATVSLHEEGEK